MALNLGSPLPRYQGEVEFVFGTVNTVTATVVTLAVTGLETDMFVMVSPTDELETGLGIAGAYVAAADVLSLIVVNPTGGNIAGGTKTLKLVAF